MPVDFSAFVGAVALLAIAWPYAQWIKHERLNPLIAYLQFVSVVALAGAGLFLAVFWIARLAGIADSLSGTGPSIVLTLLILVPAVLAGRYVVRRPPQQRMPH